MDLNWSAEELDFRDEVRRFLDANLTPELVKAGRLATSVYPDHDASMEWQRRLHARGWAAPHWHVDHGGQDWTIAQHDIFHRERIAAGAPSLSPMGISMVAHVIMQFGAPDQQAYFLPRILSGEVFFCQGYSEPNAGSDLAALNMSAVADGDDFILNGSKIWTTHATQANWMFALVRTTRGERPQQGISFLLIPMDVPGISVRPLVMASGEAVQAQVFFTDARVPRAHVIGAVDDGWRVAKYLLEFERGGNGFSPTLHEKADSIARGACTIATGCGGWLIDDPVFARKLAAAQARIEVLEILEMRLLSTASQGGSVGAQSSMIKVLGTELAQHLTELAMDAAGPLGAVFQPHAVAPGGPTPDHQPPADGHVTGADWQALAPLRYLNERAASIYAGSNEIQRNILAKLVLGL